jgi:hypothetical protein
MSKVQGPILPTVVIYKIFEMKAEFDFALKRDQELAYFSEMIEAYPDIEDTFILKLKDEKFVTLSKFAWELKKYGQGRKYKFWWLDNDRSHLQLINDELSFENCMVKLSFDTNKDKIFLGDDSTISEFDEDHDFKDNSLFTSFLENFINMENFFYKVDNKEEVSRRFYKLFDYNDWNLVEEVSYERYDVQYEDQFGNIQNEYQYDPMKTTICLKKF